MAGNGKKTPKSRSFKIKLSFSWKNLLLYGFLLLFGIFLFFSISDSIEPWKTISLSELISQVKKGDVKEIVVSDNKLDITTKNNLHEQTFKETGSNVYQLFKDAGVPTTTTKITVKDDTNINNWINILGAV